MSKTRCDFPGFFVDPSLHHTEIARSCLAKIISSLRPNICQIGEPSMLNDDVADLKETMENCLPGDLRYACQYWALHLQSSNLDQSLVDLCQSFAFESILHWLEVLSLLGDTGRVLPSLKAVRETISVSFMISLLNHSVKGKELEGHFGAAQSLGLD